MKFLVPGYVLKVHFWPPEGNLRQQPLSPDLFPVSSLRASCSGIVNMNEYVLPSFHFKIILDRIISQGIFFNVYFFIPIKTLSFTLLRWSNFSTANVYQRTQLQQVGSCINFCRYSCQECKLLKLSYFLMNTGPCFKNNDWLILFMMVTVESAGVLTPRFLTLHLHNAAVFGFIKSIMFQAHCSFFLFNHFIVFTHQLDKINKEIWEKPTEVIISLSSVCTAIGTNTVFNSNLNTLNLHSNLQQYIPIIRCAHCY